MKIEAVYQETGKSLEEVIAFLFLEEIEEE